MATFLEIHSPQPPTQCVPTTFSWDGGIAPYTLKITAVTRDFQIGDVLQTFSGIGDKSLQWPVNLVGGTVFGVVLSDSTPITVQFEPVTVQAGPDSSCLGGPMTFSETTGASSAMMTSAAGYSATSSSSATISMGTTRSAALSGSTIAGVTGTSSSSSASSSAGTTGLTGVVASSTGRPLSGGAVAGIAISAALVGVLIAVLGYWLWRRYGRRRMGSPRSIDLNESTLPPVQPPRTSKAAEAGIMRHSTMYGSPLSSPSHTAAAFPHYPSGGSNVYTEPSIYTPTPRTSRSPTMRTSRTPSASRHSSAVPPRDRLSVVNSGDEGVSPAHLSSAVEDRSLSRQVTSWAQSNSHYSVQESDAGVRLAVGPLPPPPIIVTEASEAGSLQGTAPVPPPYRQYDE